MANRKHASREVWAQRVASWKNSGESASAYAAAIGVHPKTLSYWRWKLEKQGTEKVPKRKRAAPQRSEDKAALPPRFLELMAPVESAAADRIELILPRGVRVQVPASFEVNALRRILDVLGGL